MKRLLPLALVILALLLSPSESSAQTATITGTLIDSQTLSPLGGSPFLVSVYTSTGAVTQSAPPDGAGLYTIGSLAPGTYFVRVFSSPGYVTELHDNIACIAADCPVTAGTPVSLGAGATATIDFALAKEGVITGTARRASNGSAISGLDVLVYNASTSLVTTVRTGVDGVYSVSGLAAGSYFARTALNLTAGPMDFLTELYGGVRCPSSAPVMDCRIASGTPIAVTAGATTAGIDFALDQGGTISGTVGADDTQTPLVNVGVRAFSGDVEIAATFTNASGQYTIVGLPPGVYQVAAAITGRQGRSITVSVGDGATVAGVNFSLASSSGILGGISGRLHLPCSARGNFTAMVRPIVEAYNASGALVGATPFGLFGSASCPSLAYTIDGLPAGQYYLLARDEPSDPFNPQFESTGDFVNELYNDIVCVTSDCDVTRGTPVIVTAGAVTSGVDFDLVLGKSIFVQTMRTSGDPQPSLSIFDARGVALVSVLRRPALTCCLLPEFVGLPPGTYFVKAEGSLYDGIACPDCPPTSGTPIVIRPDTPSFTLSFPLPLTRRVSGTVRDGLSAPLSTITVELYTDAGRIVGTAVTDLFGNYSIPSVFPGTHFLRTRNDRGYVDAIFANASCASCDVRTGTPVVVAAADVTGINFTLATGGVLSGRVTDTAGFAVGGVPVSLFSPAGVLAEKTVASASGQFRVTLPAGSYRARSDVSAAYGSEIFSEQPCTSNSCDVTAGTPIAVATGTITPNISFTLAGCAAMTLSPSFLASAVISVSYRQVFSVSGGVSPSEFQVTAGALPLGVSLSSSTGVLSGTPTVTGRHEFTVSAADANGCATARPYTLDVQECAFTLSPSSTTVPAVGGSVAVTIGNGCGSQLVTGTPSWVQVQSNTPGQVSFAVLANTGAAPRSAAVTIGRRVFEIRQAGVGSLPPFGALDLPLNGAQVSGAIAVGGWALDDLEVARVQIYRDAQGTEPAGVVFLGTAVFVPGARPDVQQAYPTAPLNHRAGFGFMILTNMLPNQGTGGFRIHVVAEDVEGRQMLLGSRTLFGTNTTATQPFGTIDAPAQGQTIAGSNYLNWGWALTPQPAMIPTDGSTIQVIVDGAPVGNPTYNLFRPDVAGAFPGLANTNGPVGYRAIDTTGLAEGLHTISWTVTDTRPGTSGIGSRYFTVANSADAQPPPGQGNVSSEHASIDLVVAAEPAATPVGVPAAPHSQRRAASLDTVPVSEADVTVQRGIGARRVLHADRDQPRAVTIAPLERIELALDAPSKQCMGTWAGYLVRDEVLSDLPVGASLDPSGTFYWQPGPGFAGRFPLLFVRTDCRGQDERLPVTVTIQTHMR